MTAPRSGARRGMTNGECPMTKAGGRREGWAVGVEGGRWTLNSEAPGEIEAEAVGVCGADDFF